MSDVVEPESTWPLNDGFIVDRLGTLRVVFKMGWAKVAPQALELDLAAKAMLPYNGLCGIARTDLRAPNSLGDLTVDGPVLTQTEWDFASCYLKCS